MPINWNNIRPNYNNRKDVFEELLCQIAENEKYRDKCSSRELENRMLAENMYWRECR